MMNYENPDNTLDLLTILQYKSNDKINTLSILKVNMPPGNSFYLQISIADHCHNFYM